MIDPIGNNIPSGISIIELRIEVVICLNLDFRSILRGGNL